MKIPAQDDVIVEQMQRQAFRMGRESLEAWEKVLRLHVRPKPKWMTDKMWRRLVKLVLYQSETKWKETTR